MSVLPQSHHIPRRSSAFFLLGGIMFPGRIYVVVAQDGGDKIDIAGFPVETGTVCAT